MKPAPSLQEHARVEERQPAAAAEFTGLFHEYAPFVLRVLRHLGVPPADLNDQSQEVFVAVFRGLSGFDRRSALRTWLYGICRHVASNHRRRAYLRREQPVADVPERAGSALEQERMEQRARCTDMERLLARLDDDKREVFVLYELEELTMKEVAEVCACPLQTAYSRLRAARRLLLEAYQAEHAAEPARGERHAERQHSPQSEGKA
ncbi:MAG TPA: sigma-70 family RNA polymerase sigma factor [Polyangiaceae bacterium]|nr:sigma-70 family RNA polymerase sigma factor [Polyangiaceae bacterium]